MPEPTVAAPVPLTTSGPTEGPPTVLTGTLDFSGAPPLGTVAWFVFLATLFYLIWLPPNRKFPPRPGWLQSGTRDPGVISGWRRDPVMSWDLDCNVGILTDRLADGRPLCVLDVDVRDNKQGRETLLHLIAERRIAQPLLVVRTPTGGAHLYYADTCSRKSGANVLGPGLDIKASNAYVVAPGSSIDGKFYTVGSFS